MSLNVCVLQGRLGKYPEMRRTQSGTPVCNFTLAVDRGGKDKATDWFSCVAWNQKAEFVSQYFRKGDSAIVQGRMQVREYEKDGVKQRATELVVDLMHFSGPKRKEDFTDVPDEDLPF